MVSQYSKKEGCKLHQIHFTFYYFWLILQLFIRLWLVLFSEKKSWGVSN